MYISWHGLSCFRIQTKDTTLLIDPFSGVAGVNVPRLQADIFLFSSADNPSLAAAQKTAGFVLAQPGEYEVRGVAVTGLPHTQKGEKDPVLITLYTIAAEDLLIGHLGTIAQDVSAETLERLNDVDVLIVPVGGRSVLDAKKAVEVASEVEPRLVIPCYYRIPGLKLPLDGLEPFCKELGLKAQPAEAKVRITKKELPEEMKLVVLSP